MTSGIGDFFHQLEGEIPGLTVIESVIGQLESMATTVSNVASAFPADHLLKLASELEKEVQHGLTYLGGIGKMDWRWIADNFSSTIFRSLLAGGFDLDADKIEKEAPGSVHTIDTLLAFCVAMPLGFAGVMALGKLWLAQRFPEGLADTLGKIPEEMGLNWAMGMFMNNAFEAAIGNKFEEAIMRQKRPNAPDWRVVRLMLKQHMLSETDLNERMAAMGFSPDWITKLKNMGENLLPVGDLQQMYLHGQIQRPEIMNHLDQLGFRLEDAEKLATLYIDKAETSAGTALRSVARELFRQLLIPIDEYMAILQSTNMAEREIADDLKAITFEQQVGRIRTPVSVLKSQFQHGDMTHEEATRSLILVGYTADAAADTLKAWGEQRIPHPMSAAKVLTYWYSGVLTDRNDAHSRLMATGLRDADASFLLDHPTAGGARKHALTPALVTSAYMDGVITQDQLGPALTKAGLDGDPLAYAQSVAMFKKSRLKRPPGADVPLTAAQVLDAFKVGVYDPHATQTELEKLGYSADNALILMEIKTKGADPFAKGGPAVFPNLMAAVAYMEAHGYGVRPPPDPMLTAAEQMLLMAGYTFFQSGSGIATLPGGISGGTGIPGSGPGSPGGSGGTPFTPS